MTRMRSALLAWLMLVAALGRAQAREPAAEKVPVAVGKWSGPSAGTFKSALRRGLARECRVVGAKSGRVVIDGVVTTDEKKHFSVQVIVKSAKSGEVVEQREFPFARARVSAGQANKMGHAVAEMARRAPAE